VEIRGGWHLSCFVLSSAWCAKGGFTMKLDDDGILIACGSCGTMNRLKYARLEQSAQCGKCKTALPRPNKPIDVPDAGVFDAAISKASVPVLIDFWATWCGPCHMMAPEIDKVAERAAGRALILKVDTEANPKLSDRYGIRSIPTVMIFQGGKQVQRTAGVQPAATLEQLLERQAHA
jgi:thioredoxin 2